MLNFTSTIFRYDPYPIGLTKNIFDNKYYEELVESFPDEKLFAHMPGAYHKYSLSEVNNFENYLTFLRNNNTWKIFYKYIKSQDFLVELYTVLKEKQVPFPKGKFKARFEFSSLPADGGFILPHTDIPSKVLTLIIPIVHEGEWNSSFGGGTDVLRPSNPYKYYADYKVPLNEFECLESYSYAPNQCVIFVKTFNSWHSVGPIKGIGSTLMRRTLTINIERLDV